MTRIMFAAILSVALGADAFFPKEGEANPIARGDGCAIMLEWKPSAPGAVTMREVRAGARLSACRASERAAYDAASPFIGRFAP